MSLQLPDDAGAGRTFRHLWVTCWWMLGVGVVVHAGSVIDVLMWGCIITGPHCHHCHGWAMLGLVVVAVIVVTCCCPGGDLHCQHWTTGGGWCHRNW